MTGKVILIDRDKMDIEALEKCVSILKAGRFLGVSPEGTRSKNGSLYEGKVGPSYLAGMTDSTILPLGIVGSYGASKRMLTQSLLKKVEVTVNIGKSFKLKDIEHLKRDYPQGNTREDREIKRIILVKGGGEATNTQIMPKIAKLLPQEMRGKFE